MNIPLCCSLHRLRLSSLRRTATSLLDHIRPIGLRWYIRRLANLEPSNRQHLHVVQLRADVPQTLLINGLGLLDDGLEYVQIVMQ